MIGSSFLSELANYTNDKISKVVLNDLIEIPNFEIKQVANSSIGLQYVVPAALVSLVTKIDLKDYGNEVISTNNVYVPISSDTLLLQTILIKEV
ncbi:hypothetical protein J2T12_003607 [Paenibacillus anaericanus]|uniref:ketopantoate hydroxymethyltransferase n=1 Tax=Paenibacillus anaericanus TaxID=170367 RepID=UPI0027801070|nr:ketopantoate hydroxymethyltransferase [Paenibacillus anaericanus]MDQ0090193.1 hypothetical protein [Paenibacillus anaericanus]